MALTLSTEWKQGLAVDDPQPFALNIPLFDLLFEELPQGTYARSITGNGLKLEHSIIVFDRELYRDEVQGINVLYRGEDKAGMSTEEAFNRWNKTGFDIAVPTRDGRARPLFMNFNRYSKIVGEKNADATSFSAALNAFRPTKLTSDDYYYNEQATSDAYAKGFKIFTKDAIIPYANTKDVYRNSVVFESTTVISNTWDDYQHPYTVGIFSNKVKADIILCAEAKKFNARFLPQEVAEYTAYSTIALNYTSRTVWENFRRYYNLSKVDTATLLSVDASGLVEINSVLAFLLKYCFVTLKCAFMADIVDYKDFSQQLNPQSNVRHKNLIISSQGDFRRFDDTISDGKVTKKSSESRPYIPHTTPIVDTLSDSLIDKLLSGGASEASLAEKITALIEDAVKPDSIIGSSSADVMEDRSLESATTSKGRTSQTPPPGWFDPDLRKPALTNGKDNYSDIPVVFPKEGNGIFDGRLVSPTIDDIYVILKQILGGRNSDSATPNELGYPTSSSNFTDTRIKMRTHRLMIDDKEITADPLWVDYKDSVDGLSYTVKKYINDPTEFTYTLVNALENFNRDLRTSMDDDDKFNALIKEVESSIAKSKPRGNYVYSLRELEGLIRGLQYNLEYAIKILSSTFATAAGGIQQFSRSDDIGSLEWTTNTDEFTSKEIYLSKDGTWQSVRQFFRLPICDDEDY